MTIQDGAIVRVPMDTLPTLRTNPAGTITATQSQANTGLGAIADSVVRFACQTRRRYPELWNNPIDRSVEFLSGGLVQTGWAVACQPFDNAAPGDGAYAGQVIGGQCPVNYVVTVNFVNGQGTPGSAFIVAPGPVRSVSFPVTQVAANRVWTLRVVCGPTSQVLTTSAFSTNNPSTYIREWSYTVVRQDGLPDNCGNAPPATLPPAPIPVTTGNISVNLGGQVVNVPISIGGPTMPNYPDVDFSPEIVLNGNVTVNVTPQEVIFRFPDGLPTVPSVALPSLNPVIELTPTLEVLSGNTVNIQNDVSIIRDIVEGGVTVDLSELEELIRACCCSPTYEYGVVSLATNSRGGIFNLPPDTVAVGIQKTEQLASAPSQSGEGIVPDCSPTAWVSFGYGDLPGVREHGSWDNSAFPVPPNANSFTLLGIYASKYNIYAVTKTKVVPP